MENKTKYILAIGALLLIAGGVWFLAFKGTKGETPTTINVNDTTQVNINLADKDSLEKNGFYASENYVIANTAFVRSSADKNASILDSVKFGQKLYTKNVLFDEEGGEGVVGDEALLANEKNNGYVAVYTSKPVTLSQKPIGFILESTLVEQYSFNDYKKYFSLPEFAKLDSKIKRTIIDENYFEGNSYHLTENASRSPFVTAIGDFDGDNIKDFAVMLDNMEKEYSSLIIFLTNKTTKEPYLAFRRTFQDFFKVKTFPKNSINPANGTKMTYDAVTMYGAGYANQLYYYNVETNKFENYSTSGE